MIYKKKKYFVIFVIRQQGTWTRIGRKRFHPSKEEIKFRRFGTFLINSANPTYIRGLKLFYFADVKGGESICFKGNKGAVMDPKTADLVLTRKIVSQLTTNLSSDKLKLNVMTLILGIAMGGLIGYIVAGFI